MAFNKQGQGGRGPPQSSYSSKTFTSGGGGDGTSAATAAGQASTAQPQHQARMLEAAAAAARVRHGQQQLAGRVGDGYGYGQHQQQPEVRRQMGAGGGSVLMSSFGSALHLPSPSTSTRGQPLSQWFNFGHRFRGGFRNDDGKVFSFFIFVIVKNIYTIAWGRLQKKSYKGLSEIFLKGWKGVNPILDFFMISIHALNHAKMPRKQSIYVSQKPFLFSNGTYYNIYYTLCIYVF